MRNEPGEQASIRLLGPSIRGSDAPKLPLKAYAVLALLALDYEKVAPRAALASRLWETASPVQAAASMRQLLLALRDLKRTIGASLIGADRQFVWIAPDAVVDVLQFNSLAAGGNAGAHERMISLYQGDLLEGLPGFGGELDLWIESQRTRLRDSFVEAGLACLERGVIDPATFGRLAQAAPYDERLIRVRMTQLHRQGRRRAAAELFQAFARRLEEEVGEAPELATRSLHMQLLGRTASIMPTGDTEARSTQRSGLPRVMIVPPEERAWSSRLAGSLVTDVTLALCRQRLFRMIAPYSARQVQECDPFVQAEAFNVDYVAPTRLVRGRDGVRLALTLVHVPTHEILFADQFRLRSHGLPMHREKLVQAVAACLTREIGRSELASYHVQGNASAYVNYLLGVSELESFQLASIRRARKRFRRALNEIEAFAPARAMLARTLTLEYHVLQRAETDILEEAYEVAKKAVEDNPTEAAGYRELAHANLYLKRFDQGLEQIAEASSLSPNHADILADHADLLIHNSEPRSAKRLIQQAIEINPLAPDDYHWINGSAAFALKDYAGAQASFLHMRDITGVTRILAACCAMQGDYDGAARYRDEWLAKYPDFRLADWEKHVSFRDREHTEHFTTALRNAGFS